MKRIKTEFGQVLTIRDLWPDDLKITAHDNKPIRLDKKAQKEGDLNFEYNNP